MRPRCLPCLLLLTAAIFCDLHPMRAQTTDSTRLWRDLDALVAKRLPKGSEAGICVYDLTDNRTLYRYRADKLSHPASTMKLLTAITALSRPDAEAPFRTELWYRGRVVADTLHGDLFVRGGFDPEFDEEALDSLVRSAARTPFHVIQGRICGDVSLKDSLYWGSGWLWDDNPAAFQPYLSPLMLCKGTVRVTAIPGTAGDTARLYASPASSYYLLDNRTRTRTPGAGRFRVTRNWLEGGNQVIVSGNVDRRQGSEINLAHSEAFFMHTFAERLQRAGTTCSTPRYAFDTLPADSLAHRLAVYETPMQTVINQMMKESDNLNAEAVLCRLGAQASGHRHLSAKEGLDAIRQLIDSLGYNPSDYRLADGCGLSNYNYISPELLVAFLRHAYARTEVFSKLYKALPTAGVDGTLAHRMRKDSAGYRKVHAKTGSFTGINCLAGYLQTANGHWLAFAIMNQNVLSGRPARALQDAVCNRLCSSRP